MKDKNTTESAPSGVSDRKPVKKKVDRRKTSAVKETISDTEKELIDIFKKNKKKKTIHVVNPEPLVIPNFDTTEKEQTEAPAPVIEHKVHRQLFTPARIIAFGMIVIIFIGTFLLALPISSKSREWTNFSDSVFTSCSAVCVTGLIIVDTAAHFSIFGQIVILLLMQIGGLGFMTAATMIFFVIRKRITLKNRLAMQEALNQNTTGGTVRLMKYVLILTFTIEGIGAVILSPILIIRHGAIGIFNAVFLSVSAFCNAGFENTGVSDHPFTGISNYSGNVIMMLTLSMLTILGGIGFFVMSDVFRNKRYSKLSVHTKLVLITTGILFLISMIFFMASEYNNNSTIGNMNFGNKLVNVIFHSASVRTSGFTAFEQKNMNLISQLFTIILMFIGASPASTGGGIKTTTLSILILMVIAGFRSSDEITFNKKALTRRAGFRAVSVFLFAIALVLFITMGLLLTEKNNPAIQADMTEMFFEAVSAFSTTGLSMGITANATQGGRVLIMIAMFLGRVGPLTIGLLFLKRAGAAQIKYPEANIMIG